MITSLCLLALGQTTNKSTQVSTYTSTPKETVYMVFVIAGKVYSTSAGMCMSNTAAMGA